MIAPDFWRDEKIGKCRYEERLLFIGLWSFAEDSGVGRASPKLIKADIFPYDSITARRIREGLLKLEQLGLISIYVEGKQQYYLIRNFKKHQKINRPSPLTLPVFPETGGTDGEPGAASARAVPGTGGRVEFEPPAREEVREYCEKRGNGVDPDRFFDYFEAAGWVDSKGDKVKSWKQKVISWERSGGSKRSGGAGYSRLGAAAAVIGELE
ncbi:MAG: hypothetical protein LBL09_00660 [Oscillospiraceae bacterium]|nr:hypothetical protein [Oscillospiraceae bacterium]